MVRKNRVPGRVTAVRLVILGLAAAGLVACSGESSAPSGDGGAGGAEADGSGGEGNGATGDGGTGESSGSGGTGGRDVAPPSTCDDIRASLPTRDGVVIEVSPAGDGRVTVDGSETTLRSVVQSASSGDVIELQPGTYPIAEADAGDYSGLYFTEPDVTLRGATGDASDVVIDSAYRDHGGETAAITVDARGVVLADFTVRRSIFHLVHLWANADATRIFNVHLIDGGQQFLKASPDEGTVDDVLVACSRFVMTDEGRDNVWGYGDPQGDTTCYTGGIDTHDARNWEVRYNHFEGIYCDTDPGRPAHGRKADERGDQTYAGGLAEHAIHMWNSEQGSGHMIDANTIVNCARGIGIGLVDPVYGTDVTNNTVFSEFAGSREHDVGIIVERGVDTNVSHNTVYFSHSDAYPNGIEIRFDSTSNVTVENNLANVAIAERDGATTTQAGNVTDAEAQLFVDAESGDLHLADCDAAPTTSRSPLVEQDLDGETRTDPTQVGADDCGQTP